MPVDVHEGSREAAAALTVLALRSASRFDPGRFVFPPSPTLRDADEAANILLSLPKPLHCDVVAGTDEVTVLCRPLMEDERSQRDEWLRLVADRDSIACIRRLGGTSTNRVLVRTNTGRMLVSVGDLALWRQEYSIANCSFVVWDADNDAQSLGAVARLDLGCARDEGSLTVSYMRMPRIISSLLALWHRLF